MRFWAVFSGRAIDLEYYRCPYWVFYAWTSIVQSVLLYVVVVFNYSNFPVSLIIKSYLFYIASGMQACRLPSLTARSNSPVLSGSTKQQVVGVPIHSWCKQWKVKNITPIFSVIIFFLVWFHQPIQSIWILLDYRPASVFFLDYAPCCREWCNRTRWLLHRFAIHSSDSWEITPLRLDEMASLVLRGRCFFFLLL
jgi:hypothetical protein